MTTSTIHHREGHLDRRTAHHLARHAATLRANGHDAEANEIGRDLNRAGFGNLNRRAS